MFEAFTKFIKCVYWFFYGSIGYCIHSIHLIDFLFVFDVVAHQFSVRIDLDWRFAFFFFVYREGKLLLQDNANTGRTETVQLYLFNTCLLLCRTSTKSGKWELRVLIRMNNAIRYKEEGSCTFRNLVPFIIVLSIFHCIYIGILFQL